MNWGLFGLVLDMAYSCSMVMADQKSLEAIGPMFLPYAHVSFVS